MTPSINLKIYNTISHQKEEFVPIKSPHVGMYTCGPTIYDYPTIGNWRTYTLSDLVYRTLKLFGYDVIHIMNMTDVGHLSGDNLGDSSQGEDRMAKASEKEGVDAWAIADKYGTDFINSFKYLNIIVPNNVPKATDHIKEQIDLIKKIEQKGYTYKTSDGIYFDVKAYESAGHKYGELSDIDEIKSEGMRIEPNQEKRDPRDFALWKFFATGQKRHNMQWDSPWGLGFPGWHIECSAMSMKYLGEQFDIHLGGWDLKGTHHPNEIVQSESVTEKRPFVKYWIHGAFLQVDGGRMGKSLGNAYSIHDVITRGFCPLALRYFYLTAHYRKQLNFTWEALESAQKSLFNLYKYSQKIRLDSAQIAESDTGPSQNAIDAWKKFLEAISDDLNAPQALAALIKGLENSEGDTDLIFLLDNADKILGLDLLNPPADFFKAQGKSLDRNVPNDIQKLVDERKVARQNKDYKKADEIRDQLIKMGYRVSDEAK